VKNMVGMSKGRPTWGYRLAQVGLPCGHRRLPCCDGPGFACDRPFDGTKSAEQRGIRLRTKRKVL